MTSHLGVMILFDSCVSVVFGVLMRDEAGEQWRLAGRIGAGLVLGAFALGWVMHLAF
jgi:hypothetical protein